MRIGWGLPRIVQALVLVAALALGVTPALAVHNDGKFQVDGDAFANTCGGAFPNSAGCTGEDWNTLYSCSSPGPGACTTAVACDTNGNGAVDAGECTTNHATTIATLVVDPTNDDIFTGGGSKDEKDVTSWAWTNGSVPDKDDLFEAFAAIYVEATGLSTRAPTGVPHRVLYFGANRFAVNGDAQIGFWFLQNPVATATGAHKGEFVDASTGGPVSHAVGDILILSNFVQGGGSSNIQVYVVTLIPTHNNQNCPAGSVEAKGSVGDICVKQVLNGTAGANGVCNQATGSIPADAACAATNGASATSLDPGFTPKSGGTTGQYPIVGFFEGGLDLTSLGLQGECFSTFVVETRSSQSITAVLKDFTLGAFQPCVPEIATTIIRNSDDTDVTNQSITPGTVFHDEAVVTGTGAGGDIGSGAAGVTCASGVGTKNCKVTFSFFKNQDCSGTAFSSEEKICTSDGVGTLTCTAVSSDFTAEAAQAGLGYSYLAKYNGDSKYNPVTLPTDRCEIVNVGKLDSKVTTAIYQTEDASGTDVKVNVTDNFADIVFGTQCEAAGGTCDPTTGCSISGKSCAPGGVTIKFRDQALVAPATGSCGSTGEPPCPTGSVQFTQYSNADCTSQLGQPATVAIGAASPLCNSGVPTGSVCAQSAEVTLGATGLSFRAIYLGDDVWNASVSSRCEPVCAINTGVK